MFLKTLIEKPWHLSNVLSDGGLSQEIHNLNTRKISIQVQNQMLVSHIRDYILFEELGKLNIVATLKQPIKNRCFLNMIH